MEKILLTTLSEVKAVMQRFDCSEFALDVETTGLKHDDLYLLGISLYDGYINCYINLYKNKELVAIMDYLRSIWYDAECILIGHNLSFDLQVLAKYGVFFPQASLFDTMLADHLLDERNPHGLKDVVQRELGISLPHYEDVNHNPNSKEFIEYSLRDSYYTYTLYTLYTSRLREETLDHVFYDIEMRFLPVVIQMQINGVLVDQERIKNVTKELEKKQFELEIKLHETAGLRYEIQYDLYGNLNIASKANFSSSQQLVEVLTKLGLELTETTEKGALSVGKKTIKSLKDKHKIIGLLEQYKICLKLLNAFFKPMPEHVNKDGRIHPSLLLHGTRTGRLSCQNPNLQQLPKEKKEFPIDVRSCFIARPGYKLVGCDYSGQELRVLAHISNDPTLISSFKEGKDLHLSTANDFFKLGIPAEALVETSPDYARYKKQYSKERDKAKTINFGIAYGKGSYGFSKDFNITEEEAQKILDQYFGALPAVKQAIDTCHKDVKRQGWTATLTGRRRRFDKVEKDGNKFYNKKSLREAFNFLIQGYSADMIRIAANNVHYNVHPTVWNLKPILTVHDEIVYEVREEYASQAAEYIKQCFETAVQLAVPLEASVSIGRTYAELK